jgi:putative endonuclease
MMESNDTGWCVYMLECGDGSLYTGCTNNVVRRVEQHQAGKGAKYTRSRLPVRLVFQESQADYSSALKREAAIKKMPRPQKKNLQLQAKL